MSFANLASIDSGPWPTFEIQLPQDDFNLLAWVLGEQISTTELVKSKDNYQLRGLTSEEHLLEGIIYIYIYNYYIDNIIMPLRNVLFFSMCIRYW